MLSYDTICTHLLSRLLTYCHVCHCGDYMLTLSRGETSVLRCYHAAVNCWRSVAGGGADGTDVDSCGN